MKLVEWVMVRGAGGDGWSPLPTCFTEVSEKITADRTLWQSLSSVFWLIFSRNRLIWGASWSARKLEGNFVRDTRFPAISLARNNGDGSHLNPTLIGEFLLLFLALLSNSQEKPTSIILNDNRLQFGQSMKSNPLLSVLTNFMTPCLIH